MKVINEIHCYKINGEETKVGDDRKLTIKNVWNEERLIQIELDGKTCVVAAIILEKAIKNSTYNERF